MSAPGTDPARHALADVDPGQLVRARQPPDEPIARLNFRERVATSLWFVPGFFVLAAFVASKLTVVVDRSIGATTAPSWLLGARPEAATALTSTVAAAMLTFLGVVFSTTLIAIQLAGGQYSPRVVRIFVRSRLTHVTLGVFLATFVFALNALVEIRSGADALVPGVTVSVTYLLLLTTLALFVTFLHGMARMLRVQYLLHEVTADGRASLVAMTADHIDERLLPAPVRRPVDAVVNGSRTGVVQAIDFHPLVELAARHDVWIELLVEVGEYLGAASPIARVHAAAPHPIDGDAVVGHLLLGGERTFIQDPGFALRQLVDVAIRALSPAVNDPTTAVQSIDRIVDLLATVAPHDDPPGWYHDAAEVIRLHCREPGIGRLIELSFTEIIRYGADSPQVVRRLHAAFDVLDDCARPDLLAVIAAQRDLLAATQAVLLPAAFDAVVAVADRQGLG